jgi:hypothetical protein
MLSIGLGAGFYYITRSGLIMALGSQGILLTIVGMTMLATSICVYSPICTRKRLLGKERVAFLFSATLTGVFGGLSAVFFGISPLIYGGDYWWIGLAFALAGTISFHVGLLFAILASWQQRKGVP